jgi:large subunit ribosomal protein L44
MPFQPVFSQAFRRRLALTPLRRRPQPSRNVTTAIPAPTTPPKKPSIGPRPSIPIAPPSSALSALLARLSLPPDLALHRDLITCLTHPSYFKNKRYRKANPLSTGAPTSASTSSRTSLDADRAVSDQRAEELEELDEEEETNVLLAALGNSLLGMFASEHLARKYPYLPSEALKTAVTSFVGPVACSSVGRTLGISVSAGGNLGLVQLGRGDHSGGVPIRWRRIDEEGKDVQLVLKKYRKHIRPEPREIRRQDLFEEAVAGVVRAFIGLIYQEKVSHAKPKDFRRLRVPNDLRVFMLLGRLLSTTS